MHFFCYTIVITGSIARSASHRYLIYLRGRFWGLSPHRGDTLHQWGEIWHGGGDRISCTRI